MDLLISLNVILIFLTDLGMHHGSSHRGKSDRPRCFGDHRRQQQRSVVEVENEARHHRDGDTVVGVI